MRHLGIGFAVTLASATASGGCGGASADEGEGGESSVSSEAESESSGEAESGESASTQSESESESESTGPVGPAVPEPGPDRYAFVDETVAFDASMSEAAVEYSWDFGDGSAPTPRSGDPTASHSYAQEGRYAALLTAWDAAGDPRSASALITVTRVPTHSPQVTSTVLALADGGAAVLSPDSDELTVVAYEGGEFSFGARFATCDEPRSVSLDGAHVLVACPKVGRVERISLADGSRQGVDLPHGTRPFAALRLEDAVYLSLEATGSVGRISIDPDGALLAYDGSWPVIADARGLARLPDDRLAVTRWRSADAEASWAAFDPDTSQVEVFTLAYDPSPASDTLSGGVPSYLDQVLVSPQGDRISIPSLQANFDQGLQRNGEVLDFQSTVRAVVSFVDWPGGVEDFGARKQFDDRGLASAGVYSSRGDFLFLAMRGAQAIERIDTFNEAQAGSILEVGYAPAGLALSPDDRFLFVDAYLSRELVVYAVEDFDTLPEPLARIPTVSAEPLEPEVLRGKQLFNDALDPRLDKDSYIACAHCHLDGEADHRTWDFTDRGEGIRNTASLLGHGGPNPGPLHWSANFDEVQDFEHDIRGPFSGAGLMTDAEFNSGTRNTTLGDPKAGVSAELDALAAYVESLDEFLPSPWRTPTGELTAGAEAGKLLFESPALGCTSCHTGPRLSDSGWLSPGIPRLHEVGTITPASGQRLGATLEGIDTPTLHGLWNGAPYLHDGSAPDLESVLTSKNPSDAHGVTSQLSAGELAQLVEYLLSLEG